MTHLPFIAASYALGVVIPVGFAVAAIVRAGAARRRLAAIDPRSSGRSGGSRMRGKSKGPQSARLGADAAVQPPHAAAQTNNGVAAP